VIDFQLISGKRKQEQAVIQALQRKRYNMIGISVRNIMDDVYGGDWYIPSIQRLIKSIKNALPLKDRPVIALGGSGVSIAAKDILDMCNADVAIQGEGEIAIQQLINDIEEKKLEIGKIYHEMVPTDIFDKMSYERGNGIDVEAYIKMGIAANVQTKRGCKSHCLYCSYPSIEGKYIRFRDPELVAEEVKRLISRGFKEIFFVDSVFNIPSSHATEVCKQLLSRKLDFKWHAFHAPKMITDEYLDLVKATNGHSPLQLCVESGSNEMLKNLNKSFTVDDILNAADLCNKKEIDYTFSLLMGGPGETAKTVLDTCNMLKRTKPSAVSVLTGICIHPGTPIAKNTQNILWKAENKLINPTFYPFKREILTPLYETLKEFGICFNAYVNETSRSYYNSYCDYTNAYYNPNYGGAK
jgi:radical SAM superfamily enzyme YgiQ (UPF0313 family)